MKNFKLHKKTLAVAMLAALPMSAMADGHHTSYGSQIGHKALNGLTNVATGWIELPKAIINVSNEHNVMFGASFGLLVGTMHTLSRTLSGAMDLVTFPIPSRPAVHPDYVWEDFEVSSTYGDYFDIYE